MKDTAWFDVALRISGALALFGWLFTWLLNRKKNNAETSKIERESNKSQAESYLFKLNVDEIIDKKAQLIELKYKDVIFNMQNEHFEIKKDIQGRLEKEMKRRIEAEQENEILKNELHMIKEKSDAQDEQIEILRNEINELKKKKL